MLYNRACETCPSVKLENTLVLGPGGSRRPLEASLEASAQNNVRMLCVEEMCLAKLSLLPLEYVPCRRNTLEVHAADNTKTRLIIIKAREKNFH